MKCICLCIAFWRMKSPSPKGGIINFPHFVYGSNTRTEERNKATATTTATLAASRRTLEALKPIASGAIGVLCCRMLTLPVNQSGVMLWWRLWREISSSDRIVFRRRCNRHHTNMYRTPSLRAMLCQTEEDPSKPEGRNGFANMWPQCRVATVNESALDEHVQLALKQQPPPVPCRV